MTWHTPITWQVDQLVTEADFNAQIRDNLEYLKGRIDSPETRSFHMNQTSDYATTSTEFVDIDPVNLAFTLNTNGGDVLFSFFGVVAVSGTVDINVCFDLLIDGARIGGDAGIAYVSCKGGSGASLSNGFIALTFLVRGLVAGTHNLRLQWRVTGQSATLRAGASGPSSNVRSQCWVREL